MQELEVILKTTAEIFNSLSKGAVVLSKKLDKISNDFNHTSPQKGNHRKINAVQPGKGTAAEVVYGTIKSGGKDGADMDILMAKTGFDRKKIQNIVFKLKQQQKITTKHRGVYIVS